MNALLELSSWAANFPKGQNRLAAERAKSAFLDTIGVMSLGASTPIAQNVARMFESSGTGNCVLVGQPWRAPAPTAALINAVAAHACDFDDYEDPGATHPSAVLVPLLLALGEDLASSGEALLDAYVIGLETAVQIGYGVNLSHYQLGWHATATIGPLAAAAAAGRLLGLDQQKMAYAISLATSSAAGYQTQFGTAAKPLHAGLAARSGIEAARLAQAGLNAALDSLDGPISFLTLQSGKDSAGYSDLSKRLKDGLWIERVGLTVKMSPCCGYLLPALDAALNLSKVEPLQKDGLDRLEVQLPAWQAKVVHYSHPRNANEARFSLSYGIATAFAKKKIEPTDFSDEAVKAAESAKIMDMIEIKPLEAGPWDSEIGQTGPVRLTATSRSGEVFETFVEYHKGTPQNPVSQKELQDKFRHCRSILFEETGTSRLLDLLLNLEELATIEPLTRELTLNAPSPRN
ncbi:MAG: MmgE/PrpD family protein [Kiloniellales bacterium]|nr:MmgE/PrpD family protein [Kiloniellales bacterium]